MLMTVLKGELAIKQSIAIIRCFKKMKDYLTDTNLLTNYNDLVSLLNKVNDHDVRISGVENKLDIVIDNFMNNKNLKELFIVNGQRVESDVIYQEIYSQATNSIAIVDNYANAKTLSLLKHSKENVSLTVITDFDKSENIETFIEDFKRDMGRDVRLINTKVFHDRYILIDYHQDGEKVYHAGASSKDSGIRITTIDVLSDKDLYRNVFDNIILLN